jgi:hypothetical protein
MGRSDESASPNSGKATCAVLLLCTSIVVACAVFPRLSREFNGEIAGKTSGSVMADLAADACPLVLMLAAALVFSRPRVGYGLGLLGGILYVPWFVRTEAAMYGGSWSVLNYVNAMPSDQQLTLYVEWRILSGFLIATTLACCPFRLLPRRWLFRGSPLGERSWPCLSVGLTVLATWLFNSAQPYRVPLIVDALRAEIRVLHVEKRGLRIREDVIVTYRDGQFFRHWHDRWLLQFRFEGHTTGGVLGAAIYDEVASMVTTSPLVSRRTPPAERLRSWNADGWYVVLRDERLLAFTTENRLSAPREVNDLLREIENLPTQKGDQGPIRDVCLGFCYGPVAALGFVYPNQPCFKLASHTTDCR